MDNPTAPGSFELLGSILDTRLAEARRQARTVVIVLAGWAVTVTAALVLIVAHLVTS